MHDHLYGLRPVNVIYLNVIITAIASTRDKQQPLMAISLYGVHKFCFNIKLNLVHDKTSVNWMHQAI